MCCVWFVVRCALFVVCRLLNVVGWLSSVVMCCLLHVVYCLAVAYCCELFVARR